MLTCETTEALVVREADGLLESAERARLEAHVAACEACRTLREANLAVKGAVAARSDAPVPAGFVPRVLARLGTGRAAPWLDEVDWRRWTGWALPMAAALLLVAAAAGRIHSTSVSPAPSSSSTQPASASLEPWSLSAGAEGSTVPPALRADVTSDDLLAAMLGTRVADAEGTGNER
jgi:anti-sigma factor RsiW